MRNLWQNSDSEMAGGRGRPDRIDHRARHYVSAQREIRAARRGTKNGGTRRTVTHGGRRVRHDGTRPASSNGDVCRASDLAARLGFAEIEHHAVGISTGAGDDNLAGGWRQIGPESGVTISAAAGELRRS